MAKVVPRPQLTTAEQLYFVEIFKGLATTFQHVWKNFWSSPGTMPTLSYPEQKPDIPQDYRSKHRLMKRPDGDPRLRGVLHVLDGLPGALYQYCRRRSRKRSHRETPSDLRYRFVALYLLRFMR